MRTKLKGLFGIICPNSIQKPKSSEVAFFHDYEYCSDNMPVNTKAFCGQCSSTNGYIYNANLDVSLLYSKV
jgi:hypothetical protein